MDASPISSASHNMKVSLDMTDSFNIKVSQPLSSNPLIAALTTPPSSPPHKRKANEIDISEIKVSAPKVKRAKKVIPQAPTPAGILEVQRAEAKSALALALDEATLSDPVPKPTPTSTIEILCPVDWDLPALAGLEPGEIEAYKLRAPWNPKQPSRDKIKGILRARDSTAPSAAEAYRKRFWISNRAVFLATGKYYANSLPGLGIQGGRWKHALVPETASEKKELGTIAPKSRSTPAIKYEGPVQEWYSQTADSTPAHHVEVTVRATKYKIQNHTRMRACEFRRLPHSFPGWDWHKLRSVVDYETKVIEEVTLRKSGRTMKRTRYLKDLIPNYFPGGEDDQGRFPNHPGYRLGEDWEPEVAVGGEVKPTGSWVDPFVDRVVSAGERALAEFLRK